MNDHFLPHRAAHLIRQVVDLVENDDAQIAQGCARIDHVARHLRRHDDDGSTRVDGRVARSQADVGGPKKIAQLEVLLIGQSLDRGRVESAHPLLKGDVSAKLADDRLSGTCGCGNEDGAASLDGVECLDLERVRSEAQRGDPACAQRRGSLRFGLVRGVALGGTALPHAGRLRGGRAVVSVAAVPASWWAHGDSSCIQTDNMCCARLAASPRLSGSTPRR